MYNLEDLYQKSLDNCPEIIRWSFEQKPKNFHDIKKIFDTEGSCQNFMRFLRNLKLAEELRNANCLNIQEKFAETNTWSKFISLGSELFFAHEFVKLGFEVSLIVDNCYEWKSANGQDIPSPDISIEKNGQQFLVEVARIKDDETRSDIATQINPIIKKYPFRLQIKYNEDFFNPVVCFLEREKREKQIENFVQKFQKVIASIDTDTNSLPQTKIIYGCEVEFAKSFIKQGYYAGYMTSFIRNPANKILPQIKKELERKANKREQWNNLHKEFSYLVALDIQQSLFEQEDIIPFLFGGQCHYDSDDYGKPGDSSFPTYTEP